MQFKSQHHKKHLYIPSALFANAPENPADASPEGVFFNVALLKLTLDLCLNITSWSSTSMLSWNGLSPLKFT